MKDSLKLDSNFEDLENLLKEFDKDCSNLYVKKIPIPLHDTYKNKYIWMISRETCLKLIDSYLSFVSDDFGYYIFSCLSSANNPEELDAKIDEILENDKYFLFYQKFWLYSIKSPFICHDLMNQILVNSSSEHKNILFKIFDDYFDNILYGIENWYLNVSPDIQQYLKFMEDKNQILWYLISYSIPVQIQSMLLAGSKIIPCLIALKEFSNKKDCDWIKNTLIDRLLFNSKEFLRLLASFSFAEVPKNIIPLSERLDLYNIFWNHLVVEKKFAEDLAKAIASGFSVYPQFWNYNG